MNELFLDDGRRTTRYKEAGVLIGSQTSCRSCTSGPNSLYAWQRGHGFPVPKLPDGRWSITKALIDDGMVARWKAQQTQNQRHERGGSHV